MPDDITTVRRAIAALTSCKHLRRYPADLQRRIAAVARAHPELRPCDLARRLDMAPQTLARMVASVPAVLVPVRIVEDRRPALPSVVVRGPHGVVVEGLDLVGVAELFRALS